ncbi:CPBP family intramembrane glutamic endopeptidase [Tenacibaculum caenipelagi]|uniref:CAAX prenyl protease 2/Lysostaphin resistance protein A-like domain-containing protein n=1 Tax=Tenacibaculum caenipelagi TaxID=1325435 RepID=A0A4R6TBE7_9FLAO|nr:CPBP family intramembrane glutamic endopeptidase [Tenacibaculum caenipelagi]TDQ23739.1 hypothetical protein DFQ07_2267 [Tenacibaculum caenipelagi]
MKETFHELIAYLKNPVLEKDSNQDTSYRFQKFFHLLIISILTALVLTSLFLLIEHFEWVDMNDHAVEELLKTNSKWSVIFFAVILAPTLEELFFRAPITLFHNKKSFKIAFYVFAILFGLIHLTNYNFTINLLLFAPILIAPQTILGGYLGFIRVRFGLTWSILLHACYNAFFVLISFAGDLI